VTAPHSVLTVHLIDRHGRPTAAARDEVLAFLSRRLRPASDGRPGHCGEPSRRGGPVADREPAHDGRPGHGGIHIHGGDPAADHESAHDGRPG
jgi:hypothetical protein